MPLSAPVSPRDLALKEKKLQSIEDIEAAINIMVRRLNDVYKYNRRDHDRLTEDVAGVSGGGTPSQIACRVHKDTANQTITGPAVMTQVTNLNTVDYDPQSMHDAGNSKVIIPSNGYYLIHAQADFSVTVASILHRVGAVINGSALPATRSGIRYSVSTMMYLAVSEVLALEEGDEVTMAVEHYNGDNATLSSGSTTFLSVTKMLT